MTAKGKLIKDNMTSQPKVAIREMNKDYKTNSKIVLKKTIKVATEPVPGNLYIALEDGSLVPINTSSKIANINSPTEKLIDQCMQSKPICNLSGKHQSKEKKVKITESVSLSPKFVTEALMAQNTKSSSGEYIGNTGKIGLKRKYEAKSLVEPSKKDKRTTDLELAQTVRGNCKEILHESDEYDFIYNEDNELNSGNQLTDNNSLSGIGEDEYTAPEYLYNESLVGEAPGGERLIEEIVDDDIQNEGIPNYEIPYDDIPENEIPDYKIPKDELVDDGNGEDDSTIALNDVCNEEDEYFRLVSLVTDQDSDEDSSVGYNTPFEFSTAKPPVSFANIPRPDGILKRSQAQVPLQTKSDPKMPLSSSQTVITPQLSTSKKCEGPLKNESTQKPLKIKDRFPDLPIPKNINQFGDCLKTRLGRYHYGLTLNDPPTQFFRGVLKGATGQTLAVMFGDSNFISKFEAIPLELLSHFAIDTTFRVIPKTTNGVSHVMTISLLLNNQTYLLWYAVTSCSSTELYKRILIEFQQHVMDWPFKSVLLNNDPVLCKAVLAIFPDIELYGSWFYYCYSIWKEVIINNLTGRCKQDPKLMTGVKLLMAIPYLPPQMDIASSISMVEGFQVVKQYARENELPKEFFRVMDFVAVFWFNKVKNKNFTTFGDHKNVLNFVEMTQLALLAYMKPNGNVWTLTHSFQSVAKMNNAELDKYLSGKPPSLKKNRGKKFNVPIRQNKKKLLMGTYDVKKFLEVSTLYCEEMLDIFLHPLYPTTTSEKSNYANTEGWRVKIIDS